MIFTNKIIRSTLTLYLANLGIDIIIIGVAQQRKPKFLLMGKILTELRNSPSENIPFFQNADSRFLMNTVIRSMLTLFTSCKHRYHPNFRVQANFLNFFKASVTSRCCAHETILRALHGFTHD